MRLGIGLGLFKSGLISAGVRIFSAFQTRVINDGGTVEAGTCVVNAINSSALLQQASLLLIPSGYKGGKLYAEIPTNGNGDLTWTRSGTANRTNASGNIELMGANVPRLSYMYGSCPSVLLEPQRTNLCLYSQQLDDANWSKAESSITANTTTSPDGTTNADSLIENTANGLHQTTILTSATGGVYTATIYAKPNGRNWFLFNIAAAANYGAFFDVQNGAVGTIQSNITSATIISVGNGWYRCTVIANTASISPRISITLATANNTISYTGNGTSGLYLYGGQIEAGAYPTTYIPTTSATATRVADSFSRNNIYTNGLISASGGTWFVEFRGNMAYTRDAFADGLQLTNTAVTDRFTFTFGAGSPATSLVTIRKAVGGTLTSLYLTTTSTTKIAIKWNGTTADIFANGTKVVSATSFTATQLENLTGSGADTPKFIQQMALYPEPKSDQFCIDLTTI